MTTPMPPAQTPPVPPPSPSPSAPVATTVSPKPLAPAPSATATSTAEPKEPIREQDSPAPGGGVPWILLAAALTGLVAVVLAWAKARSEARARSRLFFAEAYQWYAAYKEFPYAVRRRRTTPRETAAAEERVRLSEAMREVQANIDYFRLWTALEDPAAGAAYATLLAQCRIVAGGSVREAWREPGTSRDADMNISPARVDLSSLQQYEDAYQSAVRAALGRWWWQRAPGPVDDGSDKEPSQPLRTPADGARRRGPGPQAADGPAPPVTTEGAAAARRR